MTIPSSFVALDGTDDYWTRSRQDYAVWDQGLCTGGEFPNGVWWEGTVILNDADLLALQGWGVGYPNYAPCPAGSNGYSFDCPPTATTKQVTGTAPNFTGGKLWEASSSNIWKGDQQGPYTIKAETDLTLGQSGGMLYRKTGASVRHLVGIPVRAGPDGGAYNICRRWTQSLFDWVALYSDFPNDT